MLIVVKSQIEQRVRTIGGGGSLRRGERRDLRRHLAGQLQPAGARPIAVRQLAGRRADQVQEPVIQVVQRTERLDRKMGLPRPTADECFLHNRLPP